MRGPRIEEPLVGPMWPFEVLDRENGVGKGGKGRGEAWIWARASGDAPTALTPLVCVMFVSMVHAPHRSIAPGSHFISAGLISPQSGSGWHLCLLAEECVCCGSCCWGHGRWHTNFV